MKVGRVCTQFRTTVEKQKSKRRENGSGGGEEKREREIERVNVAAS